jgi:hypothetical protein
VFGIPVPSAACLAGACLKLALKMFPKADLLRKTIPFKQDYKLESRKLHTYHHQLEELEQIYQYANKYNKHWKLALVHVL